MCIFSKPVHSVSATNLFARGLRDGRQHLVYEMKVAMTQPTAMVLPLPLPPGSSEDAVVFTDLSDYAEFFQHMEIGFPEVARGGPVATSMLALPQSNLRVHEVGKFIASVVPTRDDFGRLYYNFNWSQLHCDLAPPNALIRNPNFRPTLSVNAAVTRDQRVHPIRMNTAVNRGYREGVLDDQGRLDGILTELDLLQALLTVMWAEGRDESD